MEDVTTIDSQTYSTNSGMEIATESATSLLSQSTILPSDSNTDNTMTSTLSTVIGTTFTNNENNDYESMTSKIIETITTTATTKITTNIIKESSDENLIQTTTTKIPILATSLIDNTLTSTTETPDFTTIATTTIKNKLSVSDLSSSLQLFGWADYLVFVLMLVVCAMIGIYFGFVEKNKQAKRNKSNGGVQARRGSEALDYLVGGRKMQTFPVSMSLVASFISGISLLGTSTEIYVYGTQYAFLLITIIISSFISWHIFLPVFCNLQLTSTYEYFEMRFDKRIRLLGSMLFVIGTMLWLPIVIYVPALAFNQVTGINIHIITPVVCVVCIFYTCVGGLKAVVWTDVLQSFIMYGSMILVIIKGTMNVGGLSEVINLNYGSGRLEGPHFTMDHTTRYSVWSVFIGSTVHWLQNTCANQVMMQRFLALPNLKKARHALIIFVIGLIVLYSFCIYNGLLIYATYHQCDPLKTKLAKAHDQLVPLLVMDILGIFPGMPGLFVAGVFSAALSSLSTGLNSLTAVFLEDFVKPYRKTPLTERQTEIFMKTAVVLCGIVCVALVFVVERLGMVLQLSATMGALTNGPLLGVFFVGVLLPWVNGRYLELRFDKTIRLFGSILFTFAVIIWLPIVIFVPALAFNQVTGVNIHIVTPVVCIVCIFYTCVGGLKAVVWTDVIQSFVMFGSILIVIFKGTLGVGGFGEVFKRNFESGRIEAPTVTFDPSVRLSIWSVYIGGTLYWTQAVATNQVMTQRFLALPSTKSAKHALCIFTFGLVFLYCCTFYNGMLIFAKYHKCDPLTTKLAKAKDQLVPLLVMDVLSEFPGLPGLFVAGVFSAALSSLSTGLNSLSAIFLEDFLKPNISFELTERQTGLFLRTTVVVLGIISILLVFVVEQLGMVLQLSMTLSSISNGPLFGIFIMGVCMPWLNSKSAFAGGLASFVIMTYICIKAQIDIATGLLVFPTKPTSIEDCHYDFALNHTIKSTPEVLEENLDNSPAFHHMSFLWYTSFGAFLAIIFGNISICFFGRNDPDQYDTRLLAPLIRKFFKCKKCIDEMDESKEAETVLMSDVCVKNP